MQIAAVFCVYNEEEYLEYAVRAILPGVEQVILCLGLSPYTAYRAEGSLNPYPPDGTEKIVDRLYQEFPRKVQVIKGNWASQLKHRDAGLKRCLELDMDYHFLVDGDEVYREDQLRRIRQTIESHPNVGTFIIKCHTFWLSLIHI